MADKKKNYLLSRRRRERFERLTFRFDLLSVGLAVVILLATAVSAGRPYELGLPYAHGFALWFLLLLSYIPLEVIGLFNWVLGIQDNAFMRFLVLEHQALGMGLFNLGMLAVVWGLVRFWLGRRYGLAFLRTVGTFLLILLVWGAFQLLCFAAVTIWGHGGFSPLHHHLRRPAEPEKVILVDQKEP